MRFEEALKIMKDGNKVKLPSWADSGNGIRRKKVSLCIPRTEKNWTSGKLK